MRRLWRCRTASSTATRPRNGKYFSKKFANDPLASRAQHYLGVCRLQNKEYDKAQAAFLQVIRTYPKFELLENSWYLAGLVAVQRRPGGQDRAV